MEKLLSTKATQVKAPSQFLHDSRTWGQGDLVQTLREIAALGSVSFTVTTSTAAWRA